MTEEPNITHHHDGNNTEVTPRRRQGDSSSTPCTPSTFSRYLPRQAVQCFQCAETSPELVISFLWITRVGPGLNLQCTRALYGGEAVCSSLNSSQPMLKRAHKQKKMGNEKNDKHGSGSPSYGPPVTPPPDHRGPQIKFSQKKTVIFTTGTSPRFFPVLTSARTTKKRKNEKRKNKRKENIGKNKNAANT